MCNTHRVMSGDHDPRARAGRWLRSTREQAGYSASEFAQAIGAHQTSVSNYETGRSAVPEAKLDAIAQALRLTLIDVRRGLGLWVPDGLEPRTVTPEEAINADGSLSQEQRILLLDVLASVRRLSQPVR